MRAIGRNLLTVLSAAALLAACSSSKTGATGNSTTSAKASASTGGDAPSTSAAIPAVVQTLFHGTDTTPPATAPTPKAGAKVWIISCAEAAEGCALASKDTKAAGEALGWDMTVFDGKFDANDAYSTGIRQAVAAGANGIILNGVDCNDVKQAMQEAKAAGVKTVEAQNANDCSGTSLASAVVVADTAYPTPDSWAQAWGHAKAEYLQWRLGGKGLILDVVFEGVHHANEIDSGFEQGIASCTACDVVKVPVTLADLSNGGFANKMANALLRNPGVNAVVAPYDNVIQAGVAPAIAHAGLKNVVVIGGEGLTSNLALVRQNSGQTADVAYDTGWLSWAAVDTMIRAFAGQPAVAEGAGFTAVDAEHNLPASGPFASRVDYQSVYKKAWSVK